MPIQPGPRVFWFCAALLVSVVVTLAADHPAASPVEPSVPLVPVTCWSQNFDAATAPALPLAWKSQTMSGAANAWTTLASGSDTVPNHANIGSVAAASDNALVSESITLPLIPATTLTFRHAFNTEAGLDGGVLEFGFSVGGSASTEFQDIVSAGGSFVVGGYNSTLGGDNPLSGRQGWSGNSGGFITTTVNLPLPGAGQSYRTGKLRWRLGTNSSTAAGGWSIDSMAIAADPCGATATSPGAFSKIYPLYEELGPGGAPDYQSTSPTLTWAPSTNAAGYEYCVEVEDIDASCSPYISAGMATSVGLSGLATGTAYAWRVRALDAGGGPPLHAGGDGRFMTVPDPPVAPGGFTKISPLSGSTNRPTTLALNWTASAGATDYEVCIDKTDNGLCGSLWEPVGNVTSFVVKNLDPSTLHSWHVRAVNVVGTTYADAGTTAFSPFTTSSASRIPVIDLDGDGTGDALAQDLSSGEGTWQRYVPGGGFLEIENNQPSADWTVTTVTNMNVAGNVDGRTDAFRFNSVTGQWYRQLNDGSGFSSSVSEGIWWQGWQRHVTNLDGDNASDMFLYDPATGVWFQCLATNACYQGGWNPGWEIHPVRLNNDAFGDFFLINRTTGRWFWALGTGPTSWNFTYPVTETWFSGWQIHPGDFNGDGLSDLLLHDPDTGVYFVAFSTSSGFTYVQGGWAAAWRPIVADLNGDGKDDVLRHDPGTGNWTQMISDGAGGFTKVGTGTWSLGWQVHPTDFDGDGKGDFLLYHPGTGVWYQARNTGPGTFAYVNGTWKPGLTILAGAIGR